MNTTRKYHPPGLSPRYYSSYDRWENKGFLDLNWEYNELDEVVGIPAHRTSLTGDRFIIRIIIGHIPSLHFQRIKRYDIRISFCYYLEDDLIASGFDHSENKLEDAQNYARWEATKLYHFLKRMDVLPPNLGDDV